MNDSRFLDKFQHVHEEMSFAYVADETGPVNQFLGAIERNLEASEAQLRVDIEDQTLEARVPYDADAGLWERWRWHQFRFGLASVGEWEVSCSRDATEERLHVVSDARIATNLDPTRIAGSDASYFRTIALTASVVLLCSLLVLGVVSSELSLGAVGGGFADVFEFVFCLAPSAVVLATLYWLSYRFAMERAIRRLLEQAAQGVQASPTGGRRSEQ